MRWLSAFLILVIIPILVPLPCRGGPLRPQSEGGYRVNAPYLPGDMRYDEAAIFWFGRVTPTDNYTDVRVGYNDEELYVRLSVVDNRLWNDPQPFADDLTSWDAVALHLDLAGNTGSAPGTSSYRLVGQLSQPGITRTAWQAAYRGDGSGWTAASMQFFTSCGYLGSGPNDDHGDNGWVLTFHVPFTSLGLSGPPHGVTWGMAVTGYDRDDAAATPIAPKTWPEGMNATQPATWGQLTFGMPAYLPPFAVPSQTSIIRQGLAGSTVVDAAVGGGTVCGQGLDYWTEWGERNYAGVDRFNVQNEADISDWPCFSKYYVTFPLPTPPAGKVMISAVLTLYQNGNAGQGAQPGPKASYVQVLTVNQAWDEATLTWNNAPLAAENVTSTWVSPIDVWPGWPGVPNRWDVSRAVAGAIARSQPSLRLALYSADSAYDSGKYFNSSDMGDWNAAGRPALTITWGTPMVNPYLVQLPLFFR